VKSAYPEYLNYGNIHVHFIFDYTRYDIPGEWGDRTIGEDGRLTGIEISVGSTLIRKYVFAYNMTERVWSYDYGGIYYSGEFTLASITQVGADGSSQLPAMTFSYTDQQIYRHNSQFTYTGNPGNPATLTWPYLTQMSSGYGGSISFAYSMIPDTSYYDIWTREVVNSKTVDTGISSNPQQWIDYTYIGNPVYRGSGWDQQYRGFGEVQEYTSDGETDHYYYTTGTISGKDAEKLTGLEYQTQSGGITTTNDWSWTATSNEGPGTYLCNLSSGEGGLAVTSDNTKLVTCRYDSNNDILYCEIRDTTYGNLINNYPWDNPWVICSGGGESPTGVAISPDDQYIYVTTNSPYPEAHHLWKFDFRGVPCGTWSLPDYPTAVTVSPDNYVYVTTSNNNTPAYTVRKYDSSGNLITSWALPDPPTGIAVSPDNYVYVTTSSLYGSNYYVRKYSSSGTSINNWTCGSLPIGIAVSQNNLIYVTMQNSFGIKYDANGNTISYLTNNGNYPGGCAIALTDNANCCFYVLYPCSPSVIVKYKDNHGNYKIQLDKTEKTDGTTTIRTRYVYDSYGNVVTEYDDGDLSTSADDSTIQRVFYPNTTANILDKPARERTYATITGDYGGSNLKAETLYYYDGNNTSNTTPPTKGNLTRKEEKKDASNSVSSYFTYDTYGNMLTSQDGNGNTTTWTYETTYHTYPATKTYPVTGLSESYTYDPGTDNMLTKTDVNGQTTTYVYDTFKRQTNTIKPGDTSQSPSIEYQYNNWGTINQQSLKTITKIDATHSLWQSQYFDGIGMVVQVQSGGESGRTIIDSTTAYNVHGQIVQQYVSQDYSSSQVNGYKTPETS
jgi:hypothetical protein